MTLRAGQKLGAAVRVALYLVCLSFAAAFGLAHSAQSQVMEALNIAMGDTRVIETDFDVVDVIVGSEAIARVSILSARSFVLTPVGPGATKVILRDSAGVQRRTINVNVTETFSQLQGILNEIVPGGTIQVRNVNGRAFVTGTVTDEALAARVLDIAASYSEGDVIDALEISDPRQVMLKVYILELSRNGGKELGINLFRNPEGMDGVNGAPFGEISKTVNLGSGGDNSVDLLVQALENKGLARRLANPTLVSVNGSTASFVVGGEVPITSSDGEGGTATSYREYGVKLTFTPEVLAGQIIRLSIMPEVSEVDWTRRVDDNPAFVSRKVETTIELESGSSFAIAGLLQRDSVRSVRQYPWLGDVPIIGALFRSSAYQKNETELVVIVTPYLVNGASFENIKGDPTIQSIDPLDADAFLLGSIENKDEMVRRFKSGFGVTGSFGHIMPGQ